MLNAPLAQFVHRWVHRIRRPERGGPTRDPRAFLRVEGCEDRIAPATLPLPDVSQTRVVGQTTTQANGFAPQAALDPTNPDKIMLVLTDGVGISVQYSTDGGQTYTEVFNNKDNTLGNTRTAFRQADPNKDPTTGFPARQWDASSSPSVAFDRNGRVYVVHMEHTNDRSSGQLLLDVYDFTGNRPTRVISNKVIYQWIGQDPAYNAVVAVDNNIDDTKLYPGITQKDTMVGEAVYVAWNSDAKVTGFTGTPANTWNPNAILVAASGDGGVTFSGATPVTSNGYTTKNGAATGDPRSANVAPQIAFSPSVSNKAGQTAGLLQLFWTDLGPAGKGSNIYTDSSRPDGGVDSQRAAVVVESPRAGSGGGIPIGASTFTADLTNSIPTGFDTITDVDVSLSLLHNNLSNLKIELVAPDGRSATLVENRIDGAGNTRGPQNAPFGLSGGTYIGVLEVNQVKQAVGMTFNQQAPRSITDPNTPAPYVVEVRPDNSAGTGGGFNFGGLGTFNGMDAKTAAGKWTLRFTDTQTTAPTNPQFLNFWSVKVTSRVSNTFFGTDTRINAVSGNSAAAGTPLPAAIDKTFSTLPTISPTVGIGPALSVAYDTTMGPNSPNRGRLYIGYTGYAQNQSNNAAINDVSDVWLLRSDTNGVSTTSFVAPVRMNDDAPIDNYSEGIRPQFQPTITVDQATGTLVSMWYDARNDASKARAATFLATSIDGGSTFSPQTYEFRSLSRTQADKTNVEGGFNTVIQQPFLNTPKTAVDAAETQTGVLFEPVPTNVPVAGANGVGTRQSVLAYGGHVIPFWSGNANQDAGGNRGPVQVYTATVRTAAGPRIIASDMGPVTNPSGPPQLTGFNVTFDRPIDKSTFDKTSIRVGFTPGGDPTGVPAPVVGTPPGIDISNQVASVTAVAGSNNTTFFVAFATPQTAVGSYSYSVSSALIRDFVVSPSITLGNEVPTPPTGFANPFTPTPANENLPIPDDSSGFPNPGTPANSVITVPTALPTGLVVSRVVVNLNITHTFGSDLIITLISPSGTRVTLVNQRGGFLTQFINTVLDDTAAQTLAAGFGDFTGTFQPDQPMTRFRGQGAQGNWTLEVVDNFPSDNGVIVTWSLTVIAADGTVVGQPVGNLIDQNANGTSNEPLFDTYAAPRSKDGRAFSIPYDTTDSLPLIIPGPRFVGAAVPGQAVPADGDTLFLNAAPTAVDIVFDRPIDSTTFTPDQIVRITGPVGTLFDASARQKDLLISPNQRTAFAKANIAFYNQIQITADPAGTPANEAGRRFRITFPQQVASGQYGVEIASSLATPAVNGFKFQLDNDEDAGLDRVLTTSANPVNFATKSYSTKDVNLQPVTIAPNSRVEMPINIADAFAITRGTNTAGVVQRPMVRLNITFPEDPDLIAELVPPPGGALDTPIRLFTNVGDRGAPASKRANFVNTLFDDLSNSPIQFGQPPFDNTNTGAYQPQFPLGDLAAFGVNSQGQWRLRIINRGTATGTLDYWTLNLPYAIVSNGLGEGVADRFTASFRVFTQDPNFQADPTGPAVSKSQWTPVGPSSIGDGSRSGRTTGLAVDPSDPSGNTVYVGGASGGVWRTNNFLNADGQPTWEPLTDFGPSTSLNTGGITVIGRNNDPNQSIVVVATGEGDTSTPGVGFLISLDAGRTWRVLDSTVNVDQSDPTRPFLPINDPNRDRLFVGTTMFKVIADPVPQASGDYYLYAAVSGGKANANGVWRSKDTGRTWERVQAGDATDVVLALGSAQQRPNPGNPSETITGNTEVLFAAIRGQGVYFTPQATSVALNGMTLQNGPAGNSLFRDADVASNPQVPVAAPSDNPNGAKGRIVLATPALTGDRRLDTIYAGWLYAVVSTPGGGNLNGIYLTKDFGANWTKVRIPLFSRTAATFDSYPSLDDSRSDFDLFAGQGNYDIAVAVDPNNPNVIYVGGAPGDNLVIGGGYIRVDVSAIFDAQAAVAYSNGRNDGGSVQFTQGSGSVEIKPAAGNLGPGKAYGPLVAADYRTINTGFVNLSRDPNNPFLSDSTIYFSNVSKFQNTGANAKWEPFDGEALADVHRIVTMRDPLTGKTRVITTDDHGTATVVDNGDGTIDAGIGFRSQPTKTRNGNLQLTQFYYGATQPSQLAADIAGALFYGMAQDNGFPVSTSDVLTTGDINWFGGAGDGSGVVTDQTGSGTVYEFRWPCCGGNLTDFIRYIPNAAALASGGVGRVNGLLLPGDNPRQDQGQWPYVAGANLAINPIDRQAVLVGAVTGGRVYRTTNEGKNWFAINIDSAGAVTTGGSYAPALAFGAPDPATPGLLNNYILMGTDSGETFVTFTGTFSGQQIDPVTNKVNWQRISFPNGTTSGTGGARAIVTNPRRGTHDAFMVTQNAVYYVADTSAPGAAWQDITGNLFSLQNPIFLGQLEGEELQPTLTPFGLEAIAADWRFANPALGSTVPTLYVGGEGGVFRSVDGGGTWTFFPDVATDKAAVEGGYLPNVHVTDLDLALGDIDPVSGLPKANGLNLLVATTYGRGTWAIRLDQDRPNNVVYQSGPRVLDNGGINIPTQAVLNTTDNLFVTFEAAVDPTSFDATDIVLTGPQGKVNVTAVVPVVNIDPLTGVDLQNKFRILFDPQVKANGQFGQYTITIGVDVRDPSGNKMNQNGQAPNGQNPADKFVRNVFLNDQATSLVVAGFPSKVVAGTNSQYTLRVEDQAGNLLTNYRGTVTFTVTGGTHNPPTTYTFTAADAGQHVFDVTFTLAGTQTLTAADDVNKLNPGKASTVVVAAPATQFFVSGYPDTVAGNSNPFTVKAVDPFGNVDTAYAGTVTISSNDPAATFTPASYTFTAGDQGAKAFTGTLRTAGPSRSITATDAKNKLTGTQTGIRVDAAAASAFAISGLPPSVTAGQPAAFTLTALDKFGNLAVGFRGDVVFDAPADPQDTVPGQYTFTPGDAGQHAFTVTFRTAGAQPVVAADPNGVIGQTSASTLVTPAAASKLGVSGFPSPVTAGAAKTFTVTAQDAFGNVATNYAGTVTLSSSDPLAGLPATVTFAASDKGVRTATGMLKTAGAQSITATDSANGFSGGQTGIQVVAAVATSLSVTPLPDPLVAGTPTGVTVTARDQFGNVATGFTGTIRFSSTDPAAGLPPDFTFAAVDAGTQNFTVSLKTVGPQSVSIEPDSGAVEAVLLSSNVKAAAASRFIVAGFPTSVRQGDAKSFTVTAKDAFGNLADGYTGTVTFSSSDPQATLPGPAALTSGKGTFTATLNTAGTQSITASDSADATVSGTQGGISVAAVVRVARFDITGFPANVRQGTAKTLTVTARDAAGNVVTGYTGPVVFTSTDPAAVLPAASPLANGVGTFSVTLNTPGTQSITVADATNSATAGTLAGVTVTPPPDTQLVGYPQFAVGADAGLTPSVRLFNASDQSERYSLTAFDPVFTGGVRTAAADFNADGVADLVAGTGPGIATQVRIFDGVTQKEIFSIAPFEASFTGGVFVAAGDIDGDGRAELAISPDEGGGPRVRVFSGSGFSQLADFFGIDDPNFRGGARAGVGDIDGDGFADLVVSAGFQGGPRVAGFSGKALVAGQTTRLFGDFFAFEQGLRNGIYVAVGDVNGDGFADLVAGGGPGGGPRVTVFSGQALLGNQQSVLGNFFGGDVNNRGGIRVSVKDVDGDQKADVLVGAGPGAGTRVTGYLGSTITPGSAPEAFGLDTLPTFAGGIFVG